MLIEDSAPIIASPTLEKKSTYKWPIVLGTVFTLSAAVLPILFVVNDAKPTGSMLSPQPQGEVSEATVTPTPLTFAQNLNLAQNYLNKAYDLARNPHQTESDKKAILASLNQSLKQATDSINLSPKDPAGYLLRAQILTAISKIKPEALSYAKEDLDLASKLSQNQNVVLPPAINPINLLPDERAEVAANFILAAPESEATSSAEATTKSNSTQKQVVLPAGQTELKIENTQVLASSYIYLIPTTKPASPIYLKSKSVGAFTLTTDQANITDQTIDYYIINE